jgi:hypothetical protein
MWPPLSVLFAGHGEGPAPRTCISELIAEHSLGLYLMSSERSWAERNEILRNAEHGLTPTAHANGALCFKLLEEVMAEERRGVRHVRSNNGSEGCAHGASRAKGHDGDKAFQKKPR